MDLKNLLIEEIVKHEDIATHFIEKIEDYGDNNEAANAAVSDDGLSRETIIEYLIASGYELTEDNFEMAKNMLISMEPDKARDVLRSASKSPQKYKIINHLEELSVEQLNSLINLAILNKAQPMPLKYQYAVEVVYDRSGATNPSELREILSKYGNLGFRVVSIFTNELGKDAITIAGFGLNTTVDQVVIVFEKPIYELKEDDKKLR